MLFPPIELMYLASIARDWHHKEVALLDAIAERISMARTLQYIESVKPDLIITISGFEIFDIDLNSISTIKQHFSSTPLCLFGHYPTEFPQLILENSATDYILDGEPDINFSSLLDYLDGRIPPEEVCGVSFLHDSKLIFNKGKGRIKKPDILPFPAHDLIKPETYFEPFLPHPFALIQTARGCPYSCNFCVRSYGQKLSVRNPQNIIDEILLLREMHQIKSFRIIDDTFTATPKRVIDFCASLIALKLDLSWTCLSRADTLNENMVSFMAMAGCKRVYIGFESGSEKILQEINKMIDLDQALDNVRLLKKYKIEVAGFFMVGHPLENIHDFEASLSFAIKADLDYIMAFQFVCYPGTKAFEKLKDHFTFSLIPYRNEFTQKQLETVARHRVKQFYLKFYFRPGYIFSRALKFLKHPVETFHNILKLVFFQINSKNQSRNDFI